jgi:hypothetical protein
VIEDVGVICGEVTADGSRWFVSYSAHDRTWTAVELGGYREADSDSASAAFATALEVPVRQLPPWAQELADALEERLRNVERDPCPCCGFLTLFGRGNWVICPVCWWEDEPHLDDDPERHSAANGLTLGAARENYATFGAVKERLRQHARAPLPDEIKR